ncbi:cell wall-binding repeat-containing protein [Euzebya sp.]|uniref:cell wall-binding repeat-containing protein n=1 Tax=Euzebya sp. TaxID=1971409 RepID=UPI003518A001
MRRQLIVVLVVGMLAGVMALPAAAHPERDATFPSGQLGTPTYRFDGPTEVVCKPDTPARLRVLPPELRQRNEALLAECEHTHLNEAIDEIRASGEQGTRILLMPGVYREEPYVGAVDESCMDIGTTEGDGGIDIGPIPLPPLDDPAEDEGNNDPGSLILTYDEQVECPYLQNLIPILGDSDGDGVCDNALCDLQIEGTGASPLDTVIDGDYSQLNGIRGDRADGLYLRNFTVQRFEFNAVYVLETDGFAFEEVLTRWNDEYGFLSFAVDHGLYQNCEGYGNGDSAIYPGSATDLNAEAGLFDDNEGLRLGTEIRGCRGHHNTLGYSGTAGNSVHTHHNEFDHNAVGAAMDSLFPDHPGLPQDHAYFHDNLFHSNNTGYFEDFVQQGVCTGPFSERDYDEGVVCPVVPLPVGSGIVLAGGNYNLYEHNTIYDNWRNGTFQFFVPATLRGEDDPLLQFDTSNFNTWRENAYGINPNGLAQPNGTDMVWDGEGEGNCWEGNTGVDGEATSAVGDGSGTAQVPGIPLPSDCDNRPPFTPGPGILAAATCAEYDRDDMPNPPLCNWFSTPEPPAGRAPEGATIERLAGDERIGTALEVSREAFPGAAANVVIATSEQFADALAGAPLAAHLEAPLLITPRAGLDDRVAEEIARLGATRAWLLGGTAALDDQVVTDLAAAGIEDVTRIGGGDRFQTAVMIAESIGSGNAFLVEGNDFASALAASAVGALVTRPVLLTPAEELAPSVRSFLQGGQVVDVRVVGQAVSEAVEGSLPEVDPDISDVERTAGADALETSALMAELGIQMGQDDTGWWIATVENWPDALGAAAAAAVAEGVLLQVPADSLGEPASALLGEKAAVAEDIRVVGGTAALSDDVVAELAEVTGGVEGDTRGDRSHGEYRSVGSIAPLPEASEAYGEVSGTATMVRTVHGTTEVELQVQGLPASTTVPVHVHVDTCANSGGDHFQFTPGGSTMPPNEIHPSFISDAQGVGRGTATAFAIAGPEARSVVLHDPDGNKVACANLSDPGLPDGVATTPALASWMAPPAVYADSLSHRLFADGQIWWWAAVAAWLIGSVLLHRTIRRRRH